MIILIKINLLFFIKLGISGVFKGIYFNYAIFMVNGVKTIKEVKSKNKRYKFALWAIKQIKEINMKDEYS